jgi:hypothetical protein
MATYLDHEQPTASSPDLSTEAANAHAMDVSDSGAHTRFSWQVPPAAGLRDALAAQALRAFRRAWQPGRSHSMFVGRQTFQRPLL